MVIYLISSLSFITLILIIVEIYNYRSFIHTIQKKLYPLSYNVPSVTSSSFKSFDNFIKLYGKMNDLKRNILKSFLESRFNGETYLNKISDMISKIMLPLMMTFLTVFTTAMFTLFVVGIENSNNENAINLVVELSEFISQLFNTNGILVIALSPFLFIFLAISIHYSLTIRLNNVIQFHLKAIEHVNKENSIQH